MTAQQVRDLSAADAPALREFFAAMPAQDRTFFFHDVDDPAVVERWAREDRRLRRCVVDADGQILALAALTPGVDWSSHVADLVLLVAPSARRQGLGRELARAMLVEAVEHGFRKVTIMIAADNTPAVDMFLGLGFQAEGLLRDQLRNPDDGAYRDTVLLAHLVDETWSTMVTGGFEEALG